MHIKLFRALKAANLSDDAAAEVVEAIEEYIAVKVQEANKGIESKLTAQTWVIGSVGFVLDRKSTRLTPVTNAHLVCRLLLETKKKKTKTRRARQEIDKKY